MKSIQRITLASLLAHSLVLGWQLEWKTFDLSGKVSLEFRLPKSTFIKGEYIDGELVAKNLTDHELIIPSLEDYTGNSHVVCIDERGEQLHTTQPIVERDRIATTRLGPRQETFAPIGVSIVVGNDPNARRGQREFLPGKYTVWVGNPAIHSTAATFVVVDIPESEKRVYEELAYLRNPEFDSAVKFARKLISTYPNSIYLPNIYFYLTLRLEIAMKQGKISEDELLRTAPEFLDRCPDSPLCNEAIIFYRSGIEKRIGVKLGSKPTKEQANELAKKLGELRSKFTNRTTNRYIEREIKRVQQ